jgi:uncharacterized membrane protein
VASDPLREVPMDPATTGRIRRRTMAAVTSTLAAVALAALVVAAPTPAGAAPQPAADPAGAFLLRDGRYTPLGGVPGAAVAAHVNVNNRGQVVGFYLDAQGGVSAFVKDRRGRVTTFAVPGASGTLAGGINDRGQVAGTYLDPGCALGGGGTPCPPGTVHGFIRQPNGRITTIDLPSQFDNTAVTDINNRGQVAGQTLDTDGRGIGFLRDPRRRIRIIRLPGRASVGDTLALNDRGQVVGYWDDRSDTPAKEPGSQHGFVWDDGRTIRFDVPRSLSTGALGINNAGQVTGSYDDAAGRHHGFVLRRGRFTTIDAPGRMVTDAWGINDRGQVVIPDLGTGLTPVTRSRQA